MDRWERDAARVGAAVQRPLGERLLLSVQAEWVTLDGEATVPGIEEPVLVVDHSRFSADAELRLLPETGGWGAALRVGIRSFAWKQVDRLAELGSDLDITRPAV